MKPEEFKIQCCPFWVQIHGFPLGLMTKKIGTVLGASIGDVEEVDVEGGQIAWGRYLRVRVMIDIRKPLKRGSNVAIPESGNELILFKYEKLPDFCYVCGRLDHQEFKCDEALDMKKNGGRTIKGYGPWMSTDSAEFLPKNNDGARKPLTGV